MNPPQTYQELKPIKKLEHLVHSFWMHRNVATQPERKTIVPDSYLKIVFVVRDGKVERYFMTGLWLKEETIITPPGATNYGCRLKILAPEYLLQQEVASILQAVQQLDIDYLNLRHFELSSFEKIVQQWQIELLKIQSAKEISPNKLRLSLLLDQVKGSISAKEVAENIFWTNRQINRYLNRYLGVSLKKYLNLQRIYQSYLQIRDGKFYPEKDYFDQAHFIKEVRRHTGETPSKLHDQQNDRFIQLKNIQPE